MKNKFTKLITAAITAFSIFAFTTTPVLAADSICDNPNVSAEIKKASGCPGADDYDLRKSIVEIINAIILALGIIAVIVIIIGGVQYMTSAGDAGKTQKAKNTILYACIGLIICVLAAAIVNFVIFNLLKNI